MIKLNKKDLANVSGGTIFRMYSNKQKKDIFYVFVDSTGKMCTMPCRNAEEAYHLNNYLNQENLYGNIEEIIEINENHPILHSFIQEL